MNLKSWLKLGIPEKKNQLFKMLCLLSTFCFAHSRKINTRKSQSNKYRNFGTKASGAKFGDLSFNFMNSFLEVYQPFGSGSCFKGDTLEMKCGLFKMCAMSNIQSPSFGCQYSIDIENCVHICIKIKNNNNS